MLTHPVGGIKERFTDMGKRANDARADYLIELIRATLLHTELPAMPADCTPEAMAKLIYGQHLTSLVYPTICTRSDLAILRKMLERSYMVQIPKITNQELEIQNWLDAAEEKGIDCIPLKGYWLRKLYPNPLMRSMTDFDVLMRDMDRSIIKSWMESLGYEAEDEKETSHHDNYIKKPWLYMELHQRLMMKPRPGWENLENNVWAHSTLMPGRKHIYQMSNEDFYIFHLVHMYKHFMSHGCGLKSVIDIHVFMKAHGDALDWDYVQQELKTMNIDVYGAYMKKLAESILGDGEADSDSKIVADYLAGCGMFGNAENARAIRIAENRGKSQKSNLLRYRLKVIFPGVAGMKRHFPSVEKYPYLLPFYWVARLFNSVFLKKKNLSTLKVDPISDQKYDDISRVLTITGVKK